LPPPLPFTSPSRNFLQLRSLRRTTSVHPSSDPLSTPPLPPFPPTTFTPTDVLRQPLGLLDSTKTIAPLSSLDPFLDSASCVRAKVMSSWIRNEPFLFCAELRSKPPPSLFLLFELFFGLCDRPPYSVSSARGPSVDEEVVDYLSFLLSFSIFILNQQSVVPPFGICKSPSALPRSHRRLSKKTALFLVPLRFHRTQVRHGFLSDLFQVGTWITRRSRSRFPSLVPLVFNFSFFTSWASSTLLFDGLF